MKLKPASLTIALVICCGLLMSASATAASKKKINEEISRGQYLVNLLGCGRCHTEGYLTGNEAKGPYLAGSRIGMAYSAYGIEESYPGVVFPSNLTGDPETGLGNWSMEEIITAMSQGIAKSGHERLLIMPWVNYNAITPSDLQAIARYLKSLGPVSRAIPDPIMQGEPSPYPYIRYGIYEFTPHKPVKDLNQ
jgi:hypothetical protein